MFTHSESSTHQTLIKWLNETLTDISLPLTQKQKLIEAMTSISGMTIGAASAYIMFILNEAFGDSVNLQLGIENDDTKNMLRIFFGLSAFIPMAALGAFNVKDAFLNAAKHFTHPKINDVAIVKNESCIIRFARTLFAIASPFSAIPQSTLTWNNISEAIMR